MEIAVEFSASSLACVPDTPGICPEVLVPFQCESGRPIGVAAVGPWRSTPPRIHEVEGIWDILGAEHLTERDEDLLLRGFIVLVVDDVRLICDHSDEKDAAAGDKVWEIQILPYGVVASGWRCIEEKFRRIVPKDLVRWKLEEDLGVDSHLEGLDGDLLPVREFGLKCNVPRLEDTHGKRGDRVVRLDAARVRIGNGDTIARPGNVRDDCGEEQARIVFREEL